MAQLPELAVRTVYTGPVTLSGLPPANDGVSPAAGDPVLLAGQGSMTDNGPYRVQSGAWIRHEEFDTAAELVTGSKFYPLEGTDFGGTEWYLQTVGPITLGTTPLVFQQRNRPRILSAGSRLEIANDQVRMRAVQGLTPGTYTFPTLTITQEGTISFAEPAGIAIPTGMVVPFAGPSSPSGWLMCNGAAVSRTTYAALFAEIGTTYGPGDGATTFNLPDLRGRAPVGAGQGAGLTNRALGGQFGSETHVLTTTEMPNHMHFNYANLASTTTVGGAGDRLTSLRNNTGGGSNATGEAVGGGGPHPNVQPSMALNFIVKT